MPSIINATTTNGVAVSGDNSGSLALQTNNGTTAVTIDTSQNVGVGTTSPLARLSVGSGSLSDANVPVQISSGGSATETYFGANKNGSYGALFGYANGAGVGTGVAIRAIQSSEPIMFFTSSNAERMRIDSSGNLLVNTTTANARLTVHAVSGAAPSYFRVFTNGDAGTFYANASGTIVGQVQVNSSSTAYVTSSDYRLKENIAPMTGALAKVAQLKPVTYTWKHDGSASQGFIAHELQEVVPECVSGEKDAVNEDGSIKPQGIDTSFLVATLTAAIQELKAELDATKAEVQALKGA